MESGQLFLIGIQLCDLVRLIPLLLELLFLCISQPIQLGVPYSFAQLQLPSLGCRCEVTHLSLRGRKLAVILALKL